jgi:arabinofuranan 3-O-arabinosyltransferase
VTALAPPRLPEPGSFDATPVVLPSAAPRPTRRRRVGRRRARRPIGFSDRMLRRVLARPMGSAICGSALISAAVVGGLWFRFGSFYARRDTAPFVRDSLSRELTSQWSHQDTAAGGPSYQIVRAVEIVARDIAHAVGGSDALAQRLLFVTIFAFAASGGAALAARLARRAWLVMLAGLLTAFNPLTMVTLPNFLIPVCIGAAGWFAALTIDAAQGRRKARPRLFALVTLSASYLAANPPLLAVLALWVCALPFLASALTRSGTRGVRRATWFLAKAAGWTLGLAAWWLVPYLSAVRAASTNGTINANTDVYTWSWTHAHGSLDRVLGLFANWSWPYANYGWNASVMGKGEFLWLAFALPIGLFAAPLVARPRHQRAALWLLTIALGLAWVGKGLEAPLANSNGWAYRHIPGMWLLREPMTKAGAVLVLATVVGWVLALDGLSVRARVLRRRRPTLSLAARGALVALVAAPVAFAIPMLSGAFVHGMDRVAVPHAWHQVGRIVNDSARPGKAIVLPLDDFYQVPTTWGFYGADTLPSQMITRPTIRYNPQAYIGEPVAFQELAHAAETSLLDTDSTAAQGALRALGVSHVIVRKDIDYDSPIRRVRMSRPGPLVRGLGAMSGARRIATTAVADVFEFEDSPPPVELISGTIAAPNEHGIGLATLAGSVPAGAAIITTDRPSLPLVRGAAWYVDVNDSDTITPPSAGEWFYQRRAEGSPFYELTSDAGSLTLHDPVGVSVDSKPLTAEPDMVLGTNARPVAADVGGRLVDLGDGAAYARIAPGTVVTALGTGTVGALGAWSGVRDCHRYDDSDPRGLLRADTVITPDQRSALRLRARRHSACLAAPVNGIASGDLVRITLEQRAVRGAPPRSCLWQAGIDQCAKPEWAVTRDGDWYRLTATYHVPREVGAMTMHIYADEPADSHASESEAWYRGITVDRLVPLATRTMPKAQSLSGSLHLDARPIAVKTSFAPPAPLISARSRVGDCARSDDRSLAASGISAASFDISDPTAVRLSARHHSACVSMPVLNVESGFDYELSFSAKTLRGAPPRACLWEIGVEACAPLVKIAAPADREGEFLYRGRIDPNVSFARIYLYADAQSMPTTIKYSHLHLKLIVDDALLLRPATVQSAAVPELHWHQDGPDRYRVDVRRSSGQFVIALVDAFATDWKVRGLPRGAHVEHVELDGYRNAWAIDARGDMNLTIEYSPSRAGHAAMRVSQLSALALIGSIAVPRLRKTRRRRAAEKRRRSDRVGPRRVQVPDAWLVPSDRRAGDPRGHKPVITL